MTFPVIISPGYGAGWSTFSDGTDGVPRSFLLHDPELVRIARSMDDKNYRDRVAEAKARLDQVYPGHTVYVDGFRDAEVVDLEDGTGFYITEFDGHEELITSADLRTYEP